MQYFSTTKGLQLLTLVLKQVIKVNKLESQD